MSREAVIAVIAEVLRSCGLPAVDDPTADLYDEFHFDSFDMVDVCIGVEDALSVRLDETLLAEVRTVESFAAMVLAALD
jgi:acyl carrier protein